MTDFDIAIDADRHFMHLVLRGYWDMGMFDAFARAFRKALQDLGRTGGARYALVDARDFAVQSVEIAGKFGALIAESYADAMPRTATLTATTLNKLQADRAGVQNARYFTDLAAAEAWLFAAQDAAPDRAPAVIRAAR